MDVKKCDRKCCGKYYENYGSCRDIIKPNGANLIFRSAYSGSYKVHRSYDLCPECLKKLQEFLGGESSETNTN